MTNNLNQIAKRLNAHGQMYETEIEEVQQKQNELWVMMRQLLVSCESLLYNLMEPLNIRKFLMNYL